MIEAAMYVALGFFSATLLGLAVLPAIYRRSVRLTREALEAVNPATYAEVRASHDYDRAHHALKQLRLEQAVEREREASVRHRLETGRLKTEIVKANAAHERELSALRIELEKALRNQTGTKGKDLIAQMEQLRSQLRETEQALASTSAELDLLKSQSEGQPAQAQGWLPADDAMSLATITSLESQLATAQKRLAQLEGGSGGNTDLLLPATTHELQHALTRLEADLVDAEAQFITAQAEVTRLTILLDQSDKPRDEHLERLERDLEWADTEKARLTALVRARDRALERARSQVRQLRTDLRSVPELQTLRAGLLEVSARVLGTDTSDRSSSTPVSGKAPAGSDSLLPETGIPHALVSRIVQASRANAPEELPEPQAAAAGQLEDDDQMSTEHANTQDLEPDAKAGRSSKKDVA